MTDLRTWRQRKKYTLEKLVELLENPAGKDAAAITVSVSTLSRLERKVIARPDPALLRAVSALTNGAVPLDALMP